MNEYLYEIISEIIPQTKHGESFQACAKNYINNLYDEVFVALYNLMCKEYSRPSDVIYPLEDGILRDMFPDPIDAIREVSMNDMFNYADRWFTYDIHLVSSWKPQGLVYVDELADFLTEKYEESDLYEEEEEEEEEEE